MKRADIVFRNRSTMTLLVFMALLPACGPDVESICESLASECGVFTAECKQDGAGFEKKALDAGCERPLDDYLDCIDDAECTWRIDCLDQREVLDACTASAQ